MLAELAVYLLEESTSNYQTETTSSFEWVVMHFGKDIHCSQRISPDDFCDPLTFPLLPLIG